MSSTRSIALLLSVLAIAGCKKKSTASGGDPAGSAAPADSASAAPADSASAAPSASAAGGDDSAAPAASVVAATDDGSVPALDEGGTPTPTRPTGMSTSFTGTYACMGGLSLIQQGNGVKGTAVTRQGGTTTNYDIQCVVSGAGCEGKAVKFVSKGGGPPKPAGNTRITFRLANGGLDYTEGGAGGFCTRR
jgi:hypothetical protein